MGTRETIHPGDLSAQFPVGPRPPLDRVSREVLARAWAATDRDDDTLEPEADPIQQWGPGHAEIDDAIRDPASSAGQALKYGVRLNHLPSGRFPVNTIWLAMLVMAHPPLAEPAGLGASVWASRWQIPRPSGDASSP